MSASLSTWASASIRPVTRFLASSRSCQEDSSLPLSVVLTPLAGSTEKQEQPPPALTGIDKCLHCGAPHPNRETHFRPKGGKNNKGEADKNNQDKDSDSSSSSSVLLCYLCGRTCSTHRWDQAAARASPEGGVPNPTAWLLSGGGNNKSAPKDDDDDDGKTLDPDHEDDSNEQDKARASSAGSSSLFSLPLRLPGITTLSSSSSSSFSSSSSSSVVYSVPAVQCPLLWIVVLDGGSVAAQHADVYYPTVANLLEETLSTTLAQAEDPDLLLQHVHLGIWVAGQRQPDEECTLAILHQHQPQPSRGASSPQSPPSWRHYVSEEACSREEDLLQAVIQSIVPIHQPPPKHSDDDDKKKKKQPPAWKQSIQALANYRPWHTPTFVVPEEDQEDDDDDDDVDDDDDEDPQEDTAALSPFYRLPVGWTTEVLVEALQAYAAPAGQRPTHTDAATEAGGETATTTTTTSPLLPTRRPYAGAKLTFFLADQGLANIKAAVTAADAEDAEIQEPDGKENQPNQEDADADATADADADATAPKDDGASPQPTATSTSLSMVGRGGFGGRIHGTTPDVLGKRFPPPKVKPPKDQDEKDPATGVVKTTKKKKTKNIASQQGGDAQDSLAAWTPAGLQTHYQGQLEVDCELYYANLGKQCAEAAIGVDILCLVLQPSTTTLSSSSSPTLHPTPTDFGLPLLQLISYKSGAPGPLLFQITKLPSKKTQRKLAASAFMEGDEDDSLKRLQAEVLARTPWQPGRVFGAELRLRLSPGLLVDADAVVPDKNGKAAGQLSGPQLGPLYCEIGLAGPASPVEESTHLWRMGTCDPHTSFMLDLIHQSEDDNQKIQQRIYAAAMGYHVNLKPVLQTCFAYTTIVLMDDNDDDNDTKGKGKTAHKKKYKTVRQMRIASCPLNLTDQVEALYGSLDPEALAVVLYHKLVIANMQDGPDEFSDIAHSWLQALLVSTYRSAEEQAVRMNGEETKALQGFYPKERLLDREGDLAAEEVLLAAGHELLQSVPLMVYLLLQCDALRPALRLLPSSGLPSSCAPLLDLRMAATLQMASMTPGTLARCIAPRLQLWAGSGSSRSSKKKQNGAGSPVLDVMDLRFEAVQQAVSEDQEDVEALWLVLDAPDQVVVMKALCVLSEEQQRKNQRNVAATLGADLQQAVLEMASSYRVPPPVVVEPSVNEDTETFLTRSRLRLEDVWIEDKPYKDHSNFAAWRAQLASAVNDELLEEKT